MSGRVEGGNSIPMLGCISGRVERGNSMSSLCLGCEATSVAGVEGGCIIIPLQGCRKMEDVLLWEGDTSNTWLPWQRCFPYEVSDL